MWLPFLFHVGWLEAFVLDIIAMGGQCRPNTVHNKVRSCQKSLIHRKLMLLNSKGLHNFTYPRTDPVVIMIAIDQSGEKILLGRGVRFSFEYL